MKDPFKERVTETRPKRPLFLTKEKLLGLLENSKLGHDSEETERERLEELRKRQEATKALSKLVAKRKEPGSELRKRQYAQALESANQELERSARIEARRNYVLDLAYKRLYEETDRAKHFKVAKNLAEMLRQRDRQIEAKANMKDLSHQYDKEFVLGMLRDVEKYAEEEAEKIDKKKRDKVKNAGNWTKQRQEIQEKREKAEWERIRDGLIVREAAANYAEELQRSEIHRKKKEEEHKRMLDKQKKEKLALLDMYAQLDEADEKRANIFNEAKREMKSKHKEIREGLDRKKEQKRQYVANNMKDETIAQKIKEEEILQNAIRRAEAKHQQECAVKQAEREEALKAIQEFYEKEMEEKAKRQFEDRRRGYQERRKILEKTHKQLLAEEAGQQKKRDLGKEAQHLQLHQIAKKRMDKMAEKVEDVKDFMSHIRSLEDEEETFQRYARAEIAESESRGIDTRPMRVAARPGIECGKGPLFKQRGCIRPRYYSALSQGDELNHVERNPNLPDTKSRLGFLLH